MKSSIIVIGFIIVIASLYVGSMTQPMTSRSCVYPPIGNPECASVSFIVHPYLPDMLLGLVAGGICIPIGAKMRD